MDLLNAAIASSIMISIPSSVAFLIIFAVHKRTKEAPQSTTGKRQRPGIGLGMLIGFAAGLIIWLIWLSWGDYYVDSQNQPQGPYRPWQVVSCGATMVAATASLGLWTRWRTSGPFFTALGATAGFSFTWGMDALPHDSTGLSLFGLTLVIIGVGSGLTVTAALTAAIANAATALSNRNPKTSK
ncbi:hypothetical protein CDES_01160 [Corynebacterium deserti GIMN1.010]|uniref:Uncharacterized protein n=1 Tax=Corynebacterium deserti GIMN1.010 TaxID=931089 RepID=A0A0M4CUV8_9CORY|nr:hypothetical protein [Corynebacterium deserti]ALC04712.1 hypothetical protein CDES_01160 [Corynebacterium deserti GIMN1.010]